MMIPGPRNSDRRPWFALRLKLTLWMVAIFVAIQLMTATVVFFYQWQQLDGFFAARTEARADSVADLLRTQVGPMTDEALAAISDDLPTYALKEQWLFTLYDQSGEIVASTRRPAPASERAVLDSVFRHLDRVSTRRHLPGLREGPSASFRSRVDVSRVTTGDGTVLALLVARSDEPYEAMIDLALKVMLLTIPAGIIAAAGAGWFISGLSIAPLQHLRRIAGSLAPDAIEQEFVPTTTFSRELHVLEKDLSVTRGKLLDAFRVQERFISNVSHELKTPISVLLTEGQTLPLHELDPRARKYVLSVGEEMRRLGRMIEGFLTLTKLKGGEGITDPKPCSINDFVMEAIADCGRMAAQQGISLTPKLVESDDPPSVSGECDLLRVMMDNLLRNAIRFSPPGLQVMVTVLESGNDGIVLVRDFGPGVPAELIDRLFDRFVQAPEEVRHSRGYGLGLSIAQGIAELHGGRISVRNMPDRGCEFKVVLPVARTGTPG